jgi:sulfopyruvate decarboxylase TPP-binding subunit
MQNLSKVAADELSGPSIISAIKRSGIEIILSVPDMTTSTGLLWPISRDPELRLIRTCKEGETVGIGAGLSYCSKRALLLFQNTGLLDSINALRAVAVEYKLPICMMVGLLSKELGTPPTKSKYYGVRIVEPILDAMGIFHQCIETDADIPLIGPMVDRCYTRSEPVAILLGQPVSWPQQMSASS